MPDQNSKQRRNAPGSCYADMTCTPDQVCLDEAPRRLKYNEEETAAAAQRALEVCPTLATGSDG